MLFLTETFDLHLCNFNIAKNVNIVEIAFLQKCKYLRSFQFTHFPVLKIFKMSHMFPNHFSHKLLDYILLVKND